MEKSIKIVNWLCVGIAAIGYFGLVRENKNLAHPAGLFMALPYVLSLIASQRDTRKLGSWLALVANIVFGVLYLVLLVVGITEQVASPAFIIVWSLLYGLTPITLNIWYLIAVKLRNVS